LPFNSVVERVERKVDLKMIWKDMGMKRRFEIV